MDKQIKKLKAENKKEGKGLASLAKADKKRDPECEAGKKMMKQEKRRIMKK